MFDFVEKHKRILQVVLALTIIPFAFFGLESYTKSLRGAGDIAVVNGSPITQRDFNDELRRQQERLRSVLGAGADMSLLETPEMRRAILESLIGQRLLLTEAVKSNLALQKDAVVSAILAAPEFQEGGKFSSERYSQYLRTRGVSDEGNVAALQVEIPAGRLISALQSSAFEPRAVAQRLMALEGQTRDVTEAVIAADAFRGEVKPDEAQLKAFYDSNATAFRIPERIRAEYLVLSAEELGKAEPATDAELKAAYDARTGQMAAAEQRHAAHILLKTREEAEKLLAEARKAPQRFPELAKKFSQDTGSAVNGGDLGMVTKGSLAAKPLEDAIFALKNDEIGGVVQTEFGFHVVRVTEIQAGKERPFEDMKAELIADIAKQKGGKKFSEQAQDFNNLVYEQSDSLKPAAEKFRLKPAVTAWISRESGVGGPYMNPKLLAALFSSDAIQQRRNTDAVEVSPGVLVAARVAEHQAAKQRPFEEVRAEVERQVARREAAGLARKQGEAKLAALTKGEDAGLKWGAMKSVTRRDPQGLPADTLRKVMAADGAKLPAYVGAERGGQGYVIYRIERVIPAAASKQPEQDLARIDSQAGAEQVEAYIAALRARAKIEISADALEKKASE